MQHLTFVVLEVCLATRGRAIHYGTEDECRHVRHDGGDRGSSGPRLNVGQSTLLTLAAQKRSRCYDSPRDLRGRSMKRVIAGESGPVDTVARVPR